MGKKDYLPRWMYKYNDKVNKEVHNTCVCVCVCVCVSSPKWYLLATWWNYSEFHVTVSTTSWALTMCQTHILSHPTSPNQWGIKTVKLFAQGQRGGKEECWCSDPSYSRTKARLLLITTMSINNWENVER